MKGEIKMKETYFEVTFYLNYGGIIDKTCKNINEAISACENFIIHCDINDFGGCFIMNEWADIIFICHKSGVRKYFAEFKNHLIEVSENNFKTIYNII